jgi:hypothetical protein
MMKHNEATARYWVLSTSMKNKGVFHGNLVEKLQEKALLSTVRSNPTADNQEELFVVIQSETDEMQFIKDVAYRQPRNEIFVDDRFGAHVVDSCEVRPVLGVPHQWCQGYHGVSADSVRNRILDRIHVMTLLKAWDLRPKNIVSSKVLNGIAKSVEDFCLKVDPFHLEEYQLKQAAENAARTGMNHVDDPIPTLACQTSDLCNGKIYGLSVAVDSEMKILYEDFMVATEEVIQLWPAKRDDLNQIVSDLRMRLLGSPLPFRMLAKNFTDEITLRDMSVEGGLSTLREMHKESSQSGEDVHYLMGELYKTVVMISKFRRYEYTPKWDLLMDLIRSEKSGHNRTVRVHVELANVDDDRTGCSQQSNGTDLLPQKESEFYNHLNDDNYLWVVLDMDTILKTPHQYFLDCKAPMVWILFDLEWEQLRKSSDYSVELVETTTGVLHPSIPLERVFNNSLSATSGGTTESSKEILNDKSIMETQGKENANDYKVHVVMKNGRAFLFRGRKSVWSYQTRGPVVRKLARNLCPGDVVVLKDPKKTFQLYQNLRKALRPESIRQLQQETCKRMKDLGLSNRDVWQQFLNAGCQIEHENDVSLWRTGRSWGPRNSEDLEKLAEILESTWLRDHWREIARDIKTLDDEVKYKRITEKFLKKSAQHSPHWSVGEKDLLAKAGLNLEDFRNCLYYLEVLSIYHNHEQIGISS